MARAIFEDQKALRVDVELGDKERKRLEREIDTTMKNLQKKLLNEGGLKAQIAFGNYLGIDTAGVLEFKGEKALKAGAQHLFDMQNAMDYLEDTFDELPEAWSILNKMFRDALEDLNKMPSTVNGMLASLSSFGLNMAFEDLGGFGDAALADLRVMADEIEKLNRDIKNLDNTADKLRIDKLIQEKLILMNKVATIELDRLYDSAGKIFSMLSRMGIGEGQAMFINKEDLGRLQQADSKIQAIRRQLLDKNNAHRFEEIADQLGRALRKAKSLRDILTGSSRMERNMMIGEVTRDDAIGEITKQFPRLTDYVKSLQDLPIDHLRNLLMTAWNFADKVEDFNDNKNNFGRLAQQSERDSQVNKYKEKYGKGEAFGVSARGTFKEANLSYDEQAYQMVSNANDSMLQGIAKAMIALKSSLEELDPATDEASRALIAEHLVKLERKFGEELVKATENPSEKLAEQTAAFASAMKGEMQSAFSGLFKGEADEGESVWSTFTNRLRDSLVSNLMDTFSEQMVDGVFKGIASVFESSFQDAFGGIGESIGKLIGSVLKTLFSFSEGGPVLAAATGGYISGPGTGTSDSIPAMLSDGEYVINAESTRKYGSLVKAINDDKLRHFAKGGAVSSDRGGSMLQKSADARSKDMTTVNLSITGDVSKQTRKEVFGMLPQLATGINAYNRDKGYR